ncbi:MAG: hypothetical protein LBM98_04965 [Oscillospiraceae bacterium]|nr:hypothetical protein [Oscillospiraceae bacterium]
MGRANAFVVWDALMRSIVQAMNQRSARPRKPPSLRSTGKLAIRTQLQVRSNPVPGE